jgi:hypothetical protein
MASAPVPKGDLNLLVERLNQEGINALQGLRRYWLAQQPQKESQWLQADINGDGQEELILLLRPPAAYANLTQLAVLGQTNGKNGSGWQLLYHSFPQARQQDNGRHYSLDGVADKTADGILDVLIQDLSSGDTYVLTAVGSQNTAESLSFELISSSSP